MTKAKPDRRTKRTIPLVGVTGSIGSGKTTVSRILSDLGAAVFDADRTAREITEEEPVIEELALTFGEEVITEDGQLDRRKLAEVVFGDTGKLQQLNQMIHPRVRAKMRQFVQKKSADEEIKMVVVDAPLIYEAKLDRELDFVVVVAVNDEIAIERVMARSMMSRQEIMERLASQMPIAEKLRRADFSIDNAADESELADKVKVVFDRIIEIWQN